MDAKQERRLINETGIFGLWWNWTIAFGFVTAPVMLTLFIPRLWLPLIVFGMHLFLLWRIRHHRTGHRVVCDLIPMVCSHVLLWSAIIMVVINLLHTQWFDIWSQMEGVPVNKQIPFISILIIAPVTFLVSLIVLLSGESRSFCADCRYRRGDEIERGFLGVLFVKETAYQLRMMIYISAFVTVAAWLYYYLFYINVNLNTPDRFVFRWVPVILYVLSISYLAMRYVSLWGYYRKVVEGNLERHGDAALLRFLIMCGDHIFLNDPDAEERAGEEVLDGGAQMDTPAHMYVHVHRQMSDHEASNYFKQLSGMTEGFKVRFMYNSPNFNLGCNIFHYACFIDGYDDINESLLKGRWLTLDQIRRLGAAGRVSGLLTSEIMRLYRVCMAWKTYDRNGRRLYKIKNYRPTFRLRDFRNWDVDLNDMHWLFVSTNNEDKPFFHVKRLWRKYVNGIGR